MAVFNPSDFFEVAESLYKNEKTAAGYRTVIGRAYYAAFLMARDQAGLHSRGPGGHEGVAQHYKLKPHSEHALIGNRLDSLRVERTYADYDCTTDIGQRRAGGAIAMSRQVIKDLQNL